MSRRLFAKEEMAKERAWSTSRLAILRVFSCSARERRRLSFRSLTCFSRSASLFVVSSAADDDADAASSSVDAVSSSDFGSLHPF